MFCDQCGYRVNPLAANCPRCNAELEPITTGPSIPLQRAGQSSGPSSPPTLRLGLPPARAWFAAFGVRRIRSTAIAIIGGWFNLPFILIMTVIGMVLGGIAGAFSGTFMGPAALDRIDKFLAFVFPIPLSAVELLPTAAAQIGGLLGGLIGAVYGGGRLGWMATVWPWEQLYAGDPLWPWMVVVGQVVTAVFCGWLWIVLSATVERAVVRISGARFLSRREEEFFNPIMAEVAIALDLRTIPQLMIDDRREVNTQMYLRHMVIYRGLLEEIDYDRDAIAGLIAHELDHWRNGDVLWAQWLKGCALPLYLLYVGAIKLHNMSRFRPVQILIRVFAWSFIFCTEKIVIPVQAWDSREAEYRADAAAGAAGYGDGLRLLLSRVNQTFEAGRGGWDRAVSATHPPTELRLNRLERFGRQIPLGEEHGLGATALGSVRVRTVGRYDQ